MIPGGVRKGRGVTRSRQSAKLDRTAVVYGFCRYCRNIFSGSRRSSGPLNNFVSRISKRAGKAIVPAARGCDSVRIRSSLATFKRFKSSGDESGIRANHVRGSRQAWLLLRRRLIDFNYRRLPDGDNTMSRFATLSRVKS